MFSLYRGSFLRAGLSTGQHSTIAKFHACLKGVDQFDIQCDIFGLKNASKVWNFQEMTPLYNIFPCQRV